MLSNLLGIFNNLKSVLILSIVLVVIVLLSILLLKFKNGKWVILGFLALALIVCGVFSSFANYEYFMLRGGTIGSLSDIFTNKNKLMQEDLKFDFENFVLVATGNENEFSARLAIDTVNKKMNNKAIFVNNNPTQLVACGDTYIYSNYSYIFKDENLNELCNDTLTIKFVFNSKSSECILSTKGGLDKVSYWNKFLKKNNFIVEIKDEDYEEDNQLVIENPVSYEIKLFIKNEFCQTLTISAINRPTLPNRVGSYDIISWHDINGTIYTTATLPLQNLELYARVEFNNVVINFSYDKVNSKSIDYGVQYVGQSIKYFDDFEKSFLTQNSLKCIFDVKDFLKNEFGKFGSNLEDYSKYNDFKHEAFVQDGKYSITFCYDDPSYAPSKRIFYGRFNFFINFNEDSYTPVIELTYASYDPDNKKSTDPNECTYSLDADFEYFPISAFGSWRKDALSKDTLPFKASFVLKV